MRTRVAGSSLAVLLSFGCSGPGNDDGDAGVDAVDVVPVATTESIDGCYYASPQLVDVAGEPRVIATGSAGEVLAYAPDGALVWSASLPEPPAGHRVNQLSTSAISGTRMVVAWSVVRDEDDERTAHNVGVVDLETGELAPGFEELTLDAELPAADGTGTVSLDPRFQLQRSTLELVEAEGTELVYVALGNGPSIQPFHGWLFELDLQAWESGGAAAAVRNVFLTTPENGCDVPSGMGYSRVCGGGVWTPAGPMVRAHVDPPELIVPTGNGRVDLDIDAYAHSLLRMPIGLDFDPRCDPTSCADFDELVPSHACMSSCQDLFIARLESPDDPPLAPEDGICDGLGFLECYAFLDADLGSSAPVEVDVPGGPTVFVQPGKDGALYVVDAEHMGTLYQRLQWNDFCGTPDDPCDAIWAGTFVTEPVVTTVDGDPVVIVVSHMFDETHDAGLSAFRLVMEGEAPRLVPMWTAPERGTREARERFRQHAGRPALTTLGGEPYVWVVEVDRDAATSQGTLWGVRVRDGEVVAQAPLSNAGIRYTKPLVRENQLWIPSCNATADGEGTFEIVELVLP